MSIDAAMYARLREIAQQVARYGKVEIADGQVILTLPPSAEHDEVATRLAHQLNAQLPHTHPRHALHRNGELDCPALGRRYRPDLLIAGAMAAPSSAVLVAEVVARSAPDRAYCDKVRDYAAMGIPHHLLVDPRDGTGIVHSQPGYASREKFVFGDSIAVGPWSIDTSVLLTYGP